MQPETSSESTTDQATAPVMDVVAPPPAEKLSEPVDDKKTAGKAANQSTLPESPKPPKQQGNGVGLAIVATAIIVLGLAALATYAYLKTAK